MTCQSEIRLPATRRGFTLLELILVLAVLVTITALAVPAVSSMFTGQQLRSAADVVRARLADARVRAIRTGEVYAFFYQPGGSQYWVAPMGSGLQSLQTGASTPSFADELENEIIFSGGDTLQDIRSELAKESMSRQMSGWRPVLCYPDGTSQDAVILLRSKNGLEIQVELRGLTGTASRPLSPQSSEEN